jgi:RNA polymerase-binding transcription factor DksA
MDLEAARGRLLAERERLSKIEKTRRQEIVPPQEFELSSIDQHPADEGTETFEEERDLTVLQMVVGQIEDIDHALERIEQGTYEVCEACGKPIGEERLKARPAARFCIEDQAKAEREVVREQQRR